METLQKWVQWSSQPVCSPNKEPHSYMGGQGSPTPGQTASPQSYFQQSPSLPTSGLTEFTTTDSPSWDPPPDEPSELLAPREVAFTADAPPKQYMGVRVKMPVRELLKKIRLSKAIDCASSKEASVKTGTKETPGRTGKKRIHAQKHHRLKRHHSRAMMESVEDLDILVEVLEEDLNKSCFRQEMCGSQSHPDVASLGLQPHWQEGVSHKQLDGNRLGISWDSTKFQPYCSFPGPGVFWHGCTKLWNRMEDRTVQLCQSSVPMPQCPHRQARHGQGHDPFLKSVQNFHALAGEFGPQGHDMPGHVTSEPLEKELVILQQEMGQLKPHGGSFRGQEDSLALPFLQSQLYQEESCLRSILQERWLTPDAIGNRSVQGSVCF
ncbi:uncharacterized protein LOC143821795 [Paroedura picta]|uniref:uncharacterized protein LOC143821795 n=1 Tax=Paroedura picta TaxID=143630 RepID=UPI004055C5C4